MELKKCFKGILFIVVLLMLRHGMRIAGFGGASRYPYEEGSEDGHHAPVGSFPRFTTTSIPKVIEMAKPKERNRSAIRCKVSRIGCAPLHGGSPHVLKLPMKMSENGSLQECASLCWERKTLFLVFDGKKCICGRAIDKSYLDPKKIFVYETALCVKESFSDIFMVSTCSETDNKQISSQAVLGCFKRSFYEEETFYKVPTKRSPDQCLLACEEERFLLAIILRVDECFCLNPTSKSGYPKSVDSSRASLCNSTSQGFMTVMRTFVEDQRCPPKTFLSAELGPIGLVSFPGSGNTWVRRLVEVASGVYTGSFYNDGSLYEKGFLGEFLSWNSNKVIVTKDHCFDRSSCLGRYGKIVFILRNPYGSLLAEFNRMFSGESHVGLAKESEFKTTKWTNFVTQDSDTWLRLILLVMQSKKPTHIVFFEDLHLKPASEVAKIISFVGVKVANLEQQLLCMEGDLSGEFRRPKVKHNPYTASHVQVIEKAIKQAMSACEHNATVKERLSSYRREKD